MEKVTRFEELEVFQKARAICKEIYRITDENPFKSDYRFVQQIRAAGGSIMDNIAEGFERSGNKEFANFLFIAKGSCGEVRSQIIRANDVGFTDDDTAQLLIKESEDISKMLFTLIRSLRNSQYTGIKYAE